MKEPLRFAKLIEGVSNREWFGLIILLVVFIDLIIFLNIPFLRQIIGFFFLTILPGILILQVLKLNKINSTEKLVLSVGLSISFLMFFGLSINNLSLSLGYETPLSTIPLLVSFNLVFVVLAIVGYKINKDVVLSLPNLNLTASEKTFLIVSILFPALSIFGMHIMNTTDNNIILMFLLFLIPIYVVFVCFFNHKFPKRMYPVVIFLISISLILMLALRSNHLIGSDTHTEYYFFRYTLDNLHWSIFGHATLDACLSISLLPTIYQSILNISPEFLFKILYSLIFSISPLVVYVLSKNYIGNLYAFLASIFYISQPFFLYTASNSRTSMAVLFFALAIMTLFNDRIDPLKKRILFIVFMASCTVSHYSTTYVFFFIMFVTFIGIELFSKEYSFKKVISLTIVVLFFAFIFFWYSQVTETAFNAGVGFIENTFINLNKFFIEESRAGGLQYLLGQKTGEEEIPYKIILFFAWMTLAFIGIGIITLMIKHKEMSFPELNFKKPDFLKEKFEVGYFVIALTCVGLLIAVVALPFVSTGYDLSRLYIVAITILSVFFVIGGISLSKTLFFIKQIFKKSLSKNGLQKLFLGKKSFSKKSHYLRNNGKNGSQVQAYLIILLVLIPYFFCTTGMTYQVFGVPRALTLNSEGSQYDVMYVHDQESYGAKWLKGHTDEKAKIYADFYGDRRLKSQGAIHSPIYAKTLIEDKKAIGGYIYLRYLNVVGGKLLAGGCQRHNLTEYTHLFVGKSKIYNNGGAEVWK